LFCFALFCFGFQTFHSLSDSSFSLNVSENARPKYLILSRATISLHVRYRGRRIVGDTQGE
jgi:hypothetical protein